MRLSACLARRAMALAAALLTFGAPARAGEGEAAAPKAADPSRTQASDHYVHNWLPMPPFTATSLPSGEATSVQAKPGRMQIVMFLASWCEPCQRLMPSFQRLAKRYERLNADFSYMFAFDTKDDASGFMHEYHLDGGFLANHEVLKAYHNPELPSIYVGDRHGWLATRLLKASEADLATLDGFLREQTAY